MVILITQVEGAVRLELPDHLYHLLLFGKGPKIAEMLMLARVQETCVGNTISVQPILHMPRSAYYFHYSPILASKI